MCQVEDEDKWERERAFDIADSLENADPTCYPLEGDPECVGTVSVMMLVACLVRAWRGRLSRSRSLRLASPDRNTVSCTRD